MQNAFSARGFLQARDNQDWLAKGEKALVDLTFRASTFMRPTRIYNCVMKFASGWRTLEET